MVRGELRYVAERRRFNESIPLRLLARGALGAALCDAKLAVPAALAPKDPVLIDMLRGGVYSVSTCAAVADGFATFSGLPLVDYPLVLMDRANWLRLSSSSSDNASMADILALERNACQYH